MAKEKDIHIQIRESTPSEKHAESLHINRARKRITGTLSVFRFVDKDTNQYVYYIPALDLSAYAKSPEFAGDMLTESLIDFFDFLVSLSSERMRAELAKLGWRKDRNLNKDFSRVVIDNNGDLQNFNAVDNKIEKLELTAA